ncbi:reverse transcriptase domain-containing protein [Tanacetum coccineum]
MSNRLVERENRSLGEGIKALLGEGNKNWIEELSHVLWAHRTMIKSSHGDTPFSLTYGTEAVIPVEVGMPKYRTAVVDAVHNDEELQLNLDLLEERHERAAIREAKAKLKMTNYLGLYGGIRQQNWQPLRSDNRHRYGDTVGSSMMSGTNSMSATNHPALLLFSARLMLAVMESFNSISSLNA